jgi:hypothetical protein
LHQSERFWDLQKLSINFLYIPIFFIIKGTLLKFQNLSKSQYFENTLITKMFHQTYFSITWIFVLFWSNILSLKFYNLVLNNVAIGSSSVNCLIFRRFPIYSFMISYENLNFVNYWNLNRSKKVAMLRFSNTSNAAIFIIFIKY